MGVYFEVFGELEDGRQVEKLTFQNKNGLCVSVSTYGATLISVKAPGLNGNVEEITQCPETLKELVANESYFGATVGRFANRIAQGKFSLGGKKYELAVNNGANHLHGGRVGWDKAIWSVVQVYDDGEVLGVELRHVSPDGDEGYPGTVVATTRYVLDNHDQLWLHHSATTDSTTPLNMTNHTYWNLSGSPRTSVLDHHVALNCSSYLPVDSTSIPTGVIQDVDATPFDFRCAKSLVSQIDQLSKDGISGFDHCLVVDKNFPQEEVLGLDEGLPSICYVADVQHPTSGRRMQVWTSEPGVQFYTANYLTPMHTAMCFESQKFPNSPNESSFPSAILTPTQSYEHVTVHRFSVMSPK